MEVHHHAHTARKKWTHYFWEFLMLFLAVFCGFMAEYQLEHKIERDRAKQYIHSFYEDLKKDTSRFTDVIRSHEEKAAAFSMRKECYDKIVKGGKSDSCLTALFLNSENFMDLVYTDGTIQQLKNAGGLRLLKKEESDSILAYDNLLRMYIKSEVSGLQDRQNKIRELINSMMNYKVYAAGNFYTTPILYKKDVEAINKYFVMLEHYIIALKWYEEHIKEVKTKAINLIQYLKKEYQLN